MAGTMVWDEWVFWPVLAITLSCVATQLFGLNYALANNEAPPTSLYRHRDYLIAIPAQVSVVTPIYATMIICGGAMTGMIMFQVILSPGILKIHP